MELSVLKMTQIYSQSYMYDPEAETEPLHGLEFIDVPQSNQMQSTICVVAPVTRGTACELIIKCQTFGFTLPSAGFRSKPTVMVVVSSVHKHVRNCWRTALPWQQPLTLMWVMFYYRTDCSVRGLITVKNTKPVRFSVAKVSLTTWLCCQCHDKAH